MNEDGHVGDLVGHTPQPVRAPPPRKEPLTAADVRKMMVDLIATAQAADSLPLDTPEWAKKIAMFPIMAQWLEPADGEQLLLQFETEIERHRRAA